MVISTAIDGNCRITQGASVRVGTPTYTGRAQTTYSCVANDNCNYDVHVIANYESNGHTGFRVHNTGNTGVNLRVTGTSTKPLILVFVSYEPVRWTLSIPSGVVIDRVILVWKCANVYVYICVRLCKLGKRKKLRQDTSHVVGLLVVGKKISAYSIETLYVRNVNLFHCRVPTTLTTALWYIPLVKY